MLLGWYVVAKTKTEQKFKYKYGDYFLKIDAHIKNLVICRVTSELAKILQTCIKLNFNEYNIFLIQYL